MSKKTLEQLMADVGCEKYPQRWETIYDRVMDIYDREGCFLADPAYYENLHQKYGCFEKYMDVYKEAAMQIGEDENLGRFLLLLATALADKTHKSEDLREFKRPRTPAGKKPLGYEMVTGLAACSQLDGAYERLRGKGLPEEMIRSVLRMVPESVSTYERLYNGEKGYNLLDWVQLWVEGKLFPIGRLEIEMGSGYEGNAIVFENRKGEYITLAHDLTVHKSGYALGSRNCEVEDGAKTAMVEETENAWQGYAFDGEGRVENTQTLLPKTEWKKVLGKGNQVIRLHIPNKGPLTPESVDETLKEALQFVETYYPEYKSDFFACHSWLVDPKLKEITKKESNIAKFCSRFTPVTTKSKGNDVFNFIFCKPNMNFELIDLPERTGLERALKKHYLGGGAVYEMEGYFSTKRR